MPTATTTITNVSKQVIPILVNEIAIDKAAATSEVEATVAQQMNLPPGSEVTLESRRLDFGQLEQLRRKAMITYR